MTTATRTSGPRRTTVVLVALALYAGVLGLFVLSLGTLLGAPGGGAGARLFGGRVGIVEL